MEEVCPSRLFTATFKEARRQGLLVVAHAGETTGADTVWDAIRLLHSELIGHGLRCLDDPELVEELRQKQLPLEVCPTSNYCLGVVRQMKQQWDTAIDDFARFCALDATNPEGYLRIGECLTAKGDRVQARQVFDVALREARKGNGPKNAVEQAERALAGLGKGE